jgi:hypothetical protein
MGEEAEYRYLRKHPGLEKGYVAFMIVASIIGLVTLIF